MGLNNSLQMTTVTEDGGRTNMYATEPQMYTDPSYTERYGLATHAERAEKANGRYAMLGIIAGFISYAVTGNFFFGII